MNLWDKASRITLLVVVCSFFFAACEEELNNVGKNISGDKFELLFKEFTLPSHVIIDSLNTSQIGLLAGSYVDPEFGTVTSEAYGSFSGSTEIDLSNDNIVFDSLNLKLRLTPYYYGNKSESNVSFKIHELTEELTDISDKNNFSKVSYDIDPIGEVDYAFLPDRHEAIVTDTLLSIELSDLYFKRIQDTLSLTDSGTNENIYSTSDISPETEFYGFALIADGNKVVGVSATSHLSMVYHTLDAGVSKDTSEYIFSFDNSIFNNVFNNITSDRSGTAISGLDDANPNNPIFPENNLRYVQSGTGVTTEIDFQPFIDFFKETPAVIFNSVGISLGQIESVESFAAPIGFVLNQTNENSELTSIIDENGSPITSVLSDSGNGGPELFSIEVDTLMSNTGSYIGLPTSYFQVLKNSNIERSTVVIRPASATATNISGYTVDRFVIHQDSIKLKVFYTIPK